MTRVICAAIVILTLASPVAAQQEKTETPAQLPPKAGSPVAPDVQGQVKTLGDRLTKIEELMGVATRPSATRVLDALSNIEANTRFAWNAASVLAIFAWVVLAICLVVIPNRLTRLNEQLQAIRPPLVTAVEHFGTLAPLPGRLETLTAQLGPLQTRLDTISTKIDELTTKLDQVGVSHLTVVVPGDL